MDLDALLKDIYESVKAIYGDNFIKMILYGSRARGDYNEYSDIDILALVKCDDKSIRNFRSNLTSAITDLSFKHSIYISISVMTNNIDYFDYWKDTMPYFKNVVKDGIEISV
ncbi:MAG: nucleotidyltransferase domain-containing protein [Oscillospiraceae bacterium]|nr:nucleotidyltransferase domain-containing protein [Oscillospiraceae bacterium]